MQQSQLIGEGAVESQQVLLQTTCEKALRSPCASPAVTLTPVAKAKQVSPEEMIDCCLPDDFHGAVQADTTSFCVFLAQRYSEKGRGEQALTYYARALRLLNKKGLRTDNDRLLISDILSAIAQIHLEHMDPSKAIISLDLCLGIRRELLRWDDQRIATVLQQQASAYRIIGDSVSAVRVLEEMLGILYCAGASIPFIRQTLLELSKHQQVLGLEFEASSSREEAKRLG
jgi:tetratricopeptide (TPR) repeat protein